VLEHCPEDCPNADDRGDKADRPAHAVNNRSSNLRQRNRIWIDEPARSSHDHRDHQQRQKGLELEPQNQHQQEDNSKDQQGHKRPGRRTAWLGQSHQPDRPLPEQNR
jgi:hypothetical protein